jgi:hypothetical protein
MYIYSDHFLMQLTEKQKRGPQEVHDSSKTSTSIVCVLVFFFPFFLLFADALMLLFISVLYHKFI